MNYKRILLGVLFLPFLIPIGILLGIGIFFVFGIEYVLTGKYNQDDGGW